jgi:multicomponent Na+:H+ antiporter subunit A
VALIFLLFGAHDLAMTQFLIESLTVILFVLAFYHLPQFAQLSSVRSRLRDIVIALSVGALMTTLVLSAVAVTLYPSIAAYFMAQSLPLAHGRNIVNVILVDFRGVDTLGEITVLGVAAIGVFALLKFGRTVNHEPTNSGNLADGQAGGVTSLIFKTTARFLMPLLLLFSVFLFVRGHNEPGGGFAAGLVAATALALYSIAFSASAARRVLRVEPHGLIGLGLLAALISGLLSVAAGQPFLTGAWGYLHLPGFGQVEVGTPMLFDLGVYLAVMGVTLSVILALEEAE